MPESDGTPDLRNNLWRVFRSVVKEGFDPAGYFTIQEISRQEGLTRELFDGYLKTYGVLKSKPYRML